MGFDSANKNFTYPEWTELELSLQEIPAQYRLFTTGCPRFERHIEEELEPCKEKWRKHIEAQVGWERLARYLINRPI